MILEIFQDFSLPWDADPLSASNAIGMISQSLFQAITMYCYMIDKAQRKAVGMNACQMVADGFRVGDTSYTRASKWRKDQK